MPRKPPEPERVGAVLATAAMFGDKRAAEQHGITVRTVQNYKNLADGDAVISHHFAEKKALLYARWADGLIPAIRASVDFLQRAALAADVKDPLTIRSMAGALKILTDVAQGERVLDARFGLSAGGARAEVGAGVSDPASSERQHH